IVFTTGDANDLTVWFYNPRTGVARDIADGALSTVTVLVNNADIVFYEAAVDGQADVFYYDPEEDETGTVAEAATDEQILAVLPNGACVFSRVGSGGEHHLFSYRIGTGLVEIGLDVTALATRDKTYASYGTDSQVVFTALNGSDQELWFWDSETGQTTAIATGVNAAFKQIGNGNEVVYNVVVSGTEQDTYFYDLDDGTAATLRDASDISWVSGIADGGATRWAVILNGTATQVFMVSLVASPSTQTYSPGGAVAGGGLLANGDLVAVRADGTELALFDSSAGTWGTPINATGLVFGGDGIETGDFVYGITASAQKDLLMWDASGSNSVVLSDTTGDDVFLAKTVNSTVLFTRVVGTNTNTDLFVWDGTAETRLTDEDSAGLLHSHTVLGQYSGSR
ncbi:MAG: hypothetical protein KDC98_13610, partial [Planctomycetes bacterium]|nr:hypothetical protein [Planctomycetota bacterium]